MGRLTPNAVRLCPIPCRCSGTNPGIIISLFFLLLTEDHVPAHRKRVVITGLGVICSLGQTPAELWQSCLEGRSGVGPITLFDALHVETKIAAEVKDWEPLDHMDRKEARRADRFAQFAVAASTLAVKDAGLHIGDENANQVGVIIGNCMGGLTTLTSQWVVLNERGPNRISPFLAPMMLSDSAAGQVSIVLGARGPNFCSSSACSSGSDAIGEAAEIIRRGDALAMLAGGAEAPIVPISIACLNSAGMLSKRNDRPREASRPFDAQRDGFVLAEGGAIIVLEEMEHALSRGAGVYAELAGYGATSDGYHMTMLAVDGDGPARAMRQALADAGLNTDDVDYINAHGISTQVHDRVETMAVKSVFGERARKIPMSSTKSVTGNLVGAAGAIEALISVLAIKNGAVPPTANLTNPDPECDLDYVPNKARAATVDVALSNSFGFGGHNSVLVLRRFIE